MTLSQTSVKRYTKHKVEVIMASVSGAISSMEPSQSGSSICSGSSDANLSGSLDFSSPEFSIQAVRQELSERGVVVIRNVIPTEDCDRYISQLNEWLAKFGDGFPNNIHSIIHKYNIAHIEPCWRVRLQVKPVFAQVWGTEKLLTSTDGLAIGRPPEEGKEHFGERIPLEGQHFDQGPRRHGLHAYQGAVYLEEATEDDWCFTVMERSNQHHEEFFKQFKGGRSEFKKIQGQEVAFLYEKGCKTVRIAVPKGGLVLWDSRTVHNGARPIFGRQNNSRWRYVVFVSQTPAIWASNDDLKVKQDAYHNLKCSRHWSSNGCSNFRTGKSHLYDITELPDIARTEEAQRLAGVQPYDFGDGLPNGPCYSPEYGARERGAPQTT